MGPSANLNSPWVIVSGVNRSGSRKTEKPDQLLWFLLLWVLDCSLERGKAANPFHSLAALQKLAHHARWWSTSKAVAFTPPVTISLEIKSSGDTDGSGSRELGVEIDGIEPVVLVEEIKESELELCSAS